MVFDPVMAAGGGGSLARENLIEAFHDLLIPNASIVTPNTVEAKTLCSDADSLDACAQQLMAQGAEYVLITGGHEAQPRIENRLWGHRQFLESYHQDRVPGEFHGSGCTLASSIAGYLAHGASMASAVRDAQTYTAKAIAHGRRLGMGQLIPDRLSWSSKHH